MIKVPEELHERIAAYIDGQLPPAEAARFEVFLANTDPRLADEVLGMIADRQRIKLLPHPKAPVDLAGRVMEQIERASLLHNVEHIAHRRPWWHSKAAIAAGFAIVLSGFTYFMVRSVLSPSNNAWRTRVAQSMPQADHAKPLAEAQPATAPSLVPIPIIDNSVAVAPVDTSPTLQPPEKQPQTPIVEATQDHSVVPLTVSPTPAPIAPATAPAIASVAPAPSITHTTDIPTKVLASLPESSAGQPVVVTFSPRSKDELGTLAAALDNLNTSNRRELAKLPADTRMLFESASNGHTAYKFGGVGTAGAPDKSTPRIAPAASDTAEVVHVLLRPSQIDDLASQYNIAILARGNDTVAFPAAPANLPPTADPKTRAELLHSAGVDNPPATQPAGHQPFVDCVVTFQNP
jgi:hypothetical protein